MLDFSLSMRGLELRSGHPFGNANAIVVRWCVRDEGRTSEVKDCTEKEREREGERAVGDAARERRVDGTGGREKKAKKK